MKKWEFGKGDVPQRTLLGLPCPLLLKATWLKKVDQGNLETLLSAFLPREVASLCFPTATFLLEEVACKLHFLFHPSQNKMRI
jgi:hypothetical protein